MSDRPLHMISNVQLPKRRAADRLACPFCRQTRTAQEWLRQSFECNCSPYEDSANVLQTFKLNEHGELISYKIPEFWNIYRLAEQTFQHEREWSGGPATTFRKLLETAREQLLAVRSLLLCMVRLRPQPST